MDSSLNQVHVPVTDQFYDSTWVQPGDSSTPHSSTNARLLTKPAMHFETTNGYSDDFESTGAPYEKLRPDGGNELASPLHLYHKPRSGQNIAQSNAVVGASVDGLSDEDMWVHRDKLVAIEQREAREKGIHLPPDHSGRVTGHIQQNPVYNLKRGQADLPTTARRESWHSPPGAEQGDREVQSPSPFDIRTAEEIAQDFYEQNIPPPTHTQNGLRSSSSRIPLATSSPLPIPLEHLARNTPLPRKRDTSGHWDEDGLVYNKTRSRTQSVGSQVLLDERELSTSSPDSPPQTSPAKAKASMKSFPNSTKKGATSARNVSGPYKPRAPSGAPRGPPAQRPGSRSGSDVRPATAVNRPTGDPPWLASMFKPDPRLPPDQQILPTHAKRLQREQWEREGKPGQSFDQDLLPLATYHDQNVQEQNASQPSTESAGEKLQSEEGNATWPLKTSSSDVTRVSNNNDHAGYSTMPKVSSAPNAMALHSPKLPQPSRIQQPVQPEREKGCGCCIVM